MPHRNFEEALDKGLQFEQWVCRMLVEDGWTVINLAQTMMTQAYKGPSLHGAGDPVLPDLQASKRGVTLALECKWKFEATWTRVTESWDYGVEHWDDYAAYERNHGHPVYLLIGDYTLRKVFAGRLQTLRPRYAQSNGVTPAMHYVPQSQLRDDWRTYLNRCQTVRENRRKRGDAERQDLDGLRSA